MSLDADSLSPVATPRWIPVMTALRRSPGWWTLLVVTLIVLTAACTHPAPPVTPPAGDLRSRLATALGTSSPVSADLVADPRTELTPLTTDWLPGWTVVDVLARTMPHPRRFYAALSDDGRVEVLSGDAAAFSTVLLDAHVRIDSGPRAIAVAALFLDVTRDFQTWSYRVDSVDDIDWVPQPTAAETARRTSVIARYADRVRPPSVVGGVDGAEVRAWTVHGRDLIEHRLTTVTGYPVVDTTATVVRDLPVPESR